MRTSSEKVRNFYRAAPGGVPTQVAFSQDRRFDDVDLDRENGVIRDAAHAYSKDGGLAVLFGNLAEDGCIVKTAGVDASILKFSGPARIFESQDASVEAILGNKVKAGDVVVVRYEGPRGGPGMQEMLYPTSYIKSKGLGKACALITDGRFSGGSSGLSIGHISPEAAEGGLIGLVEEGDTIETRYSQPQDQPRGAGSRARAPPRGDGRQRQGGVEAGAAQARGLDRAEILRGLCQQRRARRGAHPSGMMFGVLRRSRSDAGRMQAGGGDLNKARKPASEPGRRVAQQFADLGHISCSLAPGASGTPGKWGFWAKSSRYQRK